MRKLTNNERDFLNNLLHLKPRLENGYYKFIFRKKKYKRSRVLMQLHLNKKLSIFENVHHKDGNKSNDDILNLKVMEAYEHKSSHGGSQKQKGSSGGSNKISKEKEKEIYKLCKIYKKNNGFPNYKKIGKLLNLAGQTVRKYYLDLESS